MALILASKSGLDLSLLRSFREGNATIV